MTEETDTKNPDSKADAIASVLLITIAIAALVFWISNQ